MLKQLFLCILITLNLVCLPTAWAAPNVPTIPNQNSFVHDYANILNEQTKSTINTLGQDLQNKTKAQIKVVTVKSLDGSSIEEYSNTLFRNWGIGNKELNNGVLLLVAVNDRKSRIEVGYGLEGALNDALTARVQDQYLIPFFKKSDYNNGVVQTYIKLVELTSKEYKVTITLPKSKQSNSNTQYPLPFYIILMIVIILFSFKGGGGKGSKRGGFGGGFGGFGGFGGGSGGGSSGGGGSSRGW